MGKKRQIGFWWERDHYENLDVGRRIILKLTSRDIGWGGMDWIYLAQDRDQWRALVTALTNHRIP
jgi:hypothetical protein